MSRLLSSFLGYEKGSSKELLLQSCNPQTGEKLTPCIAVASKGEILQAVNLAASASAAYAALAVEARRDFLDAIAQELLGKSAQIIQCAQLETGLSEGRLEAELLRTVQQLRDYGAHAAIADFWQPEQVDVEGNLPALCSQLIPLGPTLVFGAANFPLAYSAIGGDVVSALAAGCPVIAFANEAHLQTAAMVAEIVVQVACSQNLPEGTYSLVFGRGPLEGDFLVRQEKIKAIGFTGSRLTGEKIRQAVARRRSPVALHAELSSINPVLLGSGAIAHRGQQIVDELYASITTDAGQFCTCPGILFLLEGEKGDVWLEQLAQKITATPAQTMLHAGIAAAYKQRCQEVENCGGVSVVACGEVVRKDAPTLSAFGQAVLYQLQEHDFLAQIADFSQEIFGPAAVVVRVASLRSVAEMLDCLGGQLTATFWLEASEMPELGEVIAAAERNVGRVIFNSVPTGVRVCEAQVHGGPYPASLGGGSAVGKYALLRWTRRLAWQNAPPELLADTFQQALEE